MHRLFDVRIDDISSSDLAEMLIKWLDLDDSHTIFTPNPEFLLEARRDLEFAQLLNESDLSLCDGVGLQFAITALTDSRLIHRQTGIDALHLLAKLCAQKQKRLLLLGGMHGVALDAAKKLQKRYSGLDVVSIDPGYLPGTVHSLAIPANLLSEISQSHADVIAVALGQGKQERFIRELQQTTSRVKIAIGVGGAFDVISERLTRAPEWMQRSGLEWIWRVMIEPRRIKRILRAVVVFPIVVISDTVRHRRFWTAFFKVMRELKFLK